MPEYHLLLPPGWVTAEGLEDALSATGEPHSDAYTSARCTLAAGCKVMVDAGTRMLSLANQLAYRGRQVTLEFKEGMAGVMGYLDPTLFD